MTSIFNLTKDPSLISQSNNGMSRNQYEQVTASRSVVGDAFPNGTINFRFSTNGSRWWLPDRTYIRMRCRLSKVNGNRLELTDGVAPNMDMMANLFQSAEFRIAGKTVSRVSDFLPQVDAIQTRTTKSDAWIKTVGNSVNWWDSHMHARQNDITGSSASSNGSVQVKSKLDLGFTATSTFALVAATGVVTIGTVGTSRSVLDTIQAGDEFGFGGGATFKTFRVAQVIDATSFRVQPDQSQANVAATTDAWFIYRPVDDTREAKDFEITWCPPLSIFGVHHAIPASECELVLVPSTSSVYKIVAIESENLPRLPGTHYDFTVQDMYMYINTVEGPRVDNAQYYLDLKQWSCQSDNISGTALQQKQFDVSPSTRSLICAFQDKRILNDSRYSPVKFRSYVVDPNNNLGSSGDDQTAKLTRLMIQFSGQTQPSPDADPAYNTTTQVDYTTQRYVESLLATGSYWDHGGSEDIDTYYRRGSYYAFNFARDGTDRSTRVTVNCGFDGTADVSNARILLFSMASQIARVTVQNGNVTDVTVEDV
jgi:hypothetical protein